MKRLAYIFVVGLLSTVSDADGQTCQMIGNVMYCQPPAVSPSALGGGYTSQRIGGITFYNYSNPQAAQRQGLPQSSQQIGNLKYYDNGITRQSIGGIDYYSNGVTMQHIGNTDYYSNGRVCQHINNTTYCN